MSDPTGPGPGPDNAAKFAPVTAARTTFKEKEAANGKVAIGSLDEPGPHTFVEAQFNPKELEIAMNVPWTKSADTNKANAKGAKGSGGATQPIQMEFTGAEGRSLTLELLFDGYETGTEGRSVSVAQKVAVLTKLASVRNKKSTTEEFKRPHRCLAVWGSVLPAFQCVITSLSTKYTMFDAAGNPLRATCTVKLTEAEAVKLAKKK